MDLLPANSTALERKLSQTLQGATVEQNADIIRGLKLDNPPDNWLDALIWEYGLGELSTYITDKRQLIIDGIRWIRLRGTPESLHIALSWVGISADIIEPGPSSEDNEALAQTDYAPRRHFAEYDLRPHDLPTDAQICLIINLALLAQPVRSRLWRLVHGYDRGVFKLDNNPLDDALLDDDSGIRPTAAQLPCLARLADIPKLSFREIYSAHAIRAEGSVDSAISINYAYRITAWQANMPYLDDLPEPNEVRTSMTGSGSPLAPAVYFGQVWAAQPWAAAETWQNTKTIITGSHK